MRGIDDFLVRILFGIFKDFGSVFILVLCRDTRR